MSHFHKKLTQLMARNGIENIVAVSKATGIPASQFTRWKQNRTSRGKPPVLSKQDMDKICNFVGKSDIDKAELSAAHAQDKCYGPCANLVRITVGGKRQGSEVPESIATLPPEQLEWLAAIASAMHRTEIRSMVKAVVGVSKGNG